MPTKEILFNEDSKKALLTGVNKICNAVKVSLGVKGNTVAMGNQHYHDLTKDGFTIAKWVQLSDPSEAIGANIIKEVARNTVNEAGDNTTTAMVLAQAIINEGFKLIRKGANPMAVTKGINLAVSKAVDYVKSISIPIEPNSSQLTEIATISANNDKEIGAKVAELISKTGANGVARIDESQTNETYIRFVEGLELKEGYMHPVYINNEETMSAQYEKPLFLLSNEKITTDKEAIRIMTTVANMQNPRPIIIILPAIEDTALAFFFANRQKKNMPICIIRAEGYGENQKDILSDLSAVLGGKIINDMASNRAIDVDESYFGSCDKILVTSTNTTILGGGGDKQKVADRIEYVKKEVANAKNDYDRQMKEERLARLEGKVGIIYVGAKSESEMAEKKARVDDSIRSAQAALLEGIMSGGGVAGIRCATELRKLKMENKDEQLGVNIIIKALEAPYLQMRANAGFEDKKSFFGLFKKRDKYKNADISAIYELPLRGGYNFRTDKYEDLVESGVIDATKAFRSALQNASSVAATLLTCNCLIVQEDAPSQYPQIPQMR
jgi:chaperonin GroEL